MSSYFVIVSFYVPNTFIFCILHKDLVDFIEGLYGFVKK